MTDKVIALSRFRADVARSGSARARELLAAPDPAAAVAALDPIELYTLTTDLGEADAMDVMALATTEQVQRLVDIGGWSQHLPNFAYLEKWFAAALGHGQGQAAQLFDKLEEELQTLYLNRRFRIYEAREEEPPETVDSGARYLTPDGTFIVELVTEPEVVEPGAPTLRLVHDRGANTGFSPFQLVAELYHADWQRADTLFRDARHTIAAELEDELERQRQVRLEEMGFPGLSEAMRLYARRSDGQALEPRRQAPEARRPLPARYAEAFLSDSFLSAVLARVTDLELLGQIESELIYLTNAQAVVRGLEFAEADTVRIAARDVRASLSLGLELVSDGDLARAQEALRAHPLRAFFSVAASHVYKLRDWAKKADKEGLFSLAGFPRRLLSGEDIHFFSAVAEPIPRFVAAGFDEPRAFASRAELAKAQSRLEALAKLMIAAKWVIAGPLSVDAFSGLIPGANEIVGQTLLRTALVKRALGASPVSAGLAVSAEELAAFSGRFIAGEWPASHIGVAPKDISDVLATSWQKLVADVRDGGPHPDPRFLDLICKGAQ